MPALFLIAALLLTGLAPAHNIPLFGTTYTTLNGSDNIKNFPTLYNANNAAFDSSKIEVGSTSIASITTLANLSTVGTITSGTWNSTAIGVAYGGTGTTSPSTGLVMVGNGASGLKAIAPGTSGQSLVSNGPGVDPSFQSVSFDQTANYSNTGNWNFLGSTYIKNLNASSTSANPLTLNGVPFDMPSSQGASSTVLTNDGNGHLTWQLSTSTYAVGVMTATSTSGGATSGNNDAVQTVGFAPQFIRLNYYVQGHTNSAGTNIYVAQRGTALFMGTTLVYNDITWTNTAGLTGGDLGSPTLADFNGTNGTPDSTSAPTAGTGNNSGWITSDLSIVNITSTGFTIRCAFTGNGGNTGRCKASWEAWR